MQLQFYCDKKNLDTSKGIIVIFLAFLVKRDKTCGFMNGQNKSIKKVRGKTFIKK